MTIYFTSDTHFHHANILKFCKRPYASIEVMNEAFIENWNARVTQDDDIWHLGDFSFGDVKKTSAIAERLNGNIHLIFGNHDSSKIRSMKCWASAQPYAEVQIDGNLICLFHYAQRVWNQSHRGAYQFFGHTHDTLEPINRSIDVGVDTWNYRPVTFNEVREKLAVLGLNEMPKLPHR